MGDAGERRIGSGGELRILWTQNKNELYLVPHPGHFFQPEIDTPKRVLIIHGQGARFFNGFRGKKKEYKAAKTAENDFCARNRTHQTACIEPQREKHGKMRTSGFDGREKSRKKMKIPRKNLLQ
jgi:hypothetical protein